MAGRAPQRRVNLADRLQRKGVRKLLAIDGGGIRGVLSLQILARIETLLQSESQGLPCAQISAAPHVAFGWSAS